MSSFSEDNSGALMLASQCDIRTAQEMHTALLESSQHGHTVIDGSAVKHLTTPALQMLIAYKQQHPTAQMIHFSPDATACLKALGGEHLLSTGEAS